MSSLPWSSPSPSPLGRGRRPWAELTAGRSTWLTVSLAWRAGPERTAQAPRLVCDLPPRGGWALDPGDPNDPAASATSANPHGSKSSTVVSSPAVYYRPPPPSNLMQAGLLLESLPPWFSLVAAGSCIVVFQFWSYGSHILYRRFYVSKCFPPFSHQLVYEVLSLHIYLNTLLFS
jgi:hypothetical protein